jgi:hypothetical protein
MRNAQAYRILVEKPEEKRPFVRPWCILWQDNIEVDLKETGCEACGLNSTHPGQSRMIGSCEHCNEHRVSKNKRGEFLA